ncbi:MAG: FAD-binding oxidoreductase [Deltaproteobacteria bacterium]|nr:FAD-binding oxidoreductase [Deltaproteobacteria bacterium]
MAFSKEAYRELEDIVGERHISNDPAFLDSYAFQWLAELVRPNFSHYMPRPVAVIMPACTEEVQRIIKLCNKYRVKAKPISTGWYHWAAPLKEDEETLQIDLRRMNRILEIDERNRYAVVEPYVICAQLQAEVMKLGLNINIIGAGASTSIVASACAYAGMGPSSFWMGNNSDNLLGMEWVTPEGEIIRTGSLGSGNGWFCGEGPGPSVRGICRGWVGSRGGLGVYTKCAIKLAHWPGPTEYQVKGTLPGYRLPIQENFRVYTLAAPTWDAWADIYYKIYDNEIGYIFHRQYALAGADLGPALWLTYIDPEKTLNDVEEAVKRKDIQDLTEELRISFQFIMAGRSIREIELQDKILDQILKETGGWKVQRYCEKDMAEFTNTYMQRLGHKHMNFVWVGGYLGSWMQTGTPDWVKGYVPVAIKGLYRDAAGGNLVQCGGDALMGNGSSIAGGGNMGLEQFVSYDPADNASVAAGTQHMRDAIVDAVANGFPPGKEAMYLQVGESDEQIWNALRRTPQPLAFHFQRKIKEAFDPNNVGDRMYATLPSEGKP